MEAWDVVIFGAGNTAFCAAHAARETEASVLVLERAPKVENDGNPGLPPAQCGSPMIALKISNPFVRTYLMIR